MTYSVGHAPITVLPIEDLEDLPWHDVPGWDGALERVMWNDASTGSTAGVMSLCPGAAHGHHVHPGAGHHIYVLGGTLRIGEETLVRGGYAYIPPGADHGPDAAGPEGCTLFFVYEAN